MQVATTTSDHALPDGELRLLGAVRTVTGAMTTVSAGGATLLVDCGVPQGRDAQGFVFPSAAREVDAVLLTHAHNDHVGSLPALFDAGFEGPVLGTPATLEIARLVLSDGLRLSGASDVEIRRFLALLDERTRPVRYGQPATLVGFDGSVCFHEAGHILGSASVEIETAQSRVLCSGDLGRPDSPILRDYNTTWRAHRPFDVVVCESTYGDREHSHDHDAIPEQLRRLIQRAHDLKGHLLVPAFAIGRTQLLLYHLNALVEAGRVPKTPVAVDTPMGLQVTESYQRFERLYDKEALSRIGRGDDPLDFQRLYAVRRSSDSGRLSEVPGPMIIIAGSGMCTGGRIVGHLLELLPRQSTTLLFVGFQAPGTPGWDIQQAARSAAKRRVVIAGREVALRAQVETLPGLSAHADRTELCRWLRAIPNPERVVLHHGEPQAQQALAQALGAQPAGTPRG